MFSSVFGRVSSSSATQASGSSPVNRDSRQINDSVHELHRPLGIPSVQVILFQGLQLGDYTDAHLSTCQSEDGSCVWPKAWLVEDIPGAHVLSYGGCLRTTSDGGVDLYIIGENLLSDLLQEKIGQEPGCPVLLVGHSIGGLVIKQLCKQAHDTLNTTPGSERMKFQAFLNNVKGAFYYSTPHYGSPVAENLAKTMGESSMLTYFKTLSTDSARLNYGFDAICKYYDAWSFAGVGETRPTNLGLFEDIVAPKSSTRLGVNFNLVDGADHFSICRPRNKSVRSFWQLKELLTEVDNGIVQGNAARVLWDLVQGDENGAGNGEVDSIRSKIVNEDGAIAGLVKCLFEHTKPFLQEQAAGALAYLAGGDADLSSQAIANEPSATAGLVKLLSQDNNGNTRENAAGALWNSAAKHDRLRLKIGYVDGVS